MRIKGCIKKIKRYVQTPKFLQALTFFPMKKIYTKNLKRKDLPASESSNVSMLSAESIKSSSAQQLSSKVQKSLFEEHSTKSSRLSLSPSSSMLSCRSTSLTPSFTKENTISRSENPATLLSSKKSRQTQNRKPIEPPRNDPEKQRSENVTILHQSFHTEPSVATLNKTNIISTLSVLTSWSKISQQDSSTNSSTKEKEIMSPSTITLQNLNATANCTALH